MFSPLYFPVHNFITLLYFFYIVLFNRCTLSCFFFLLAKLILPRAPCPRVDSSVRYTRLLRFLGAYGKILGHLFPETFFLITVNAYTTQF